MNFKNLRLSLQIKENIIISFLLNQYLNMVKLSVRIFLLYSVSYLQMTKVDSSSKLTIVSLLCLTVG